jgi:hypothetical protein
MHRLSIAAAALISATSGVMADGPNLGRVVSPEEIATWDISIAPDGKNLPHGSGTPAQGEAVYRATCQSCVVERHHPCGQHNERRNPARGTHAQPRHVLFSRSR